MQYDRQCVPIKCRRLSRRHPFFRRLSSNAGLGCRSLQPDRVLRYRAFMVVDQTLAPVIWFALINGQQASDAVGARWRAICGHDDGLPDLEAMFRHSWLPIISSHSGADQTSLRSGKVSKMRDCRSPFHNANRAAWGVRTTRTCAMRIAPINLG